jgi:hypothetical protein
MTHIPDDATEAEAAELAAEQRSLARHARMAAATRESDEAFTHVLSGRDAVTDWREALGYDPITGGSL